MCVQEFLVYLYCIFAVVENCFCYTFCHLRCTLLVVHYIERSLWFKLVVCCDGN